MHIKKINNIMRKMGKGNRLFLEEKNPMINKTMKKTLNLTSNPGNANENNKTPFYPHLTDKISESENTE